MNKETKSQLPYLLNPLFEKLNAQNVFYCVCSNYISLPEYTDHDVDIWTKNPKEFEGILFTIAKQHGFSLYLHNVTANGSNNFFYKKIGNTIDVIRIDLLCETACLSFIPIVRASLIGESRVKYKNFYVAEGAVEAGMNLLYPLLHSGQVKDKYKERIYSFRNNVKFKEILINALGNATAEYLFQKIDGKDWKNIEKKVRNFKLKVLLSFIIHDNIKVIKGFLKFIITNVKRLFRPSGLFIVFVGPDGSGKSTIVDILFSSSKQLFISDKIKKFYWRPFLLPRLTKFLPFKRNKENKENESIGIRNIKLTFLNRFLFIIKYMYYSLDFIIGRIKYQFCWSRGGIVIFDRYYYDHMVYPERFGFKVPFGLMKFMLKFVPEPNLNFYLYAPPEELEKRKKDLQIEEIIRQQNKYEQIILTFRNAYKINSSRPLDEVQKEIIRICLDFMAKRVKREKKDG